MDDAAARFGRAELRPLWDALRHRLERSEGPVRSVRVRLRTEAERAALADLLGLPRLPGEQATVRVDRIDAILGEVGLDARSVVEAVGGPMRSLAAERRDRAAARARLWAWLAGHPDVVAEPALGRWTDYVRGNGLVNGSVAATRSLVELVFAVLRALPGTGGPLAEFADRVCGDPHALDDGRPSAYVLRALACRYDEPVPASAAERRALWRRAGIACDALSVSVLAAGLRPNGDAPFAVTCRAWADAGQAVRITLAQTQSIASLGYGAGPAGLASDCVERAGPESIGTVGHGAGAGGLASDCAERAGRESIASPRSTTPAGLASDCVERAGPESIGTVGHGAGAGGLASDCAEGAGTQAVIAGRSLWVVENPAVVAAALDRFGPGCPPLACTSGWPNTAVVELLRLLVAAGLSPRVHADLDGEGLRIAAYVLAKTGGTPWRMTTADYLSVAPDQGPPPGRVSEVPWDADLGATMRDRNVAVYEERVVGTLLDDMAPAVR